MVFSTAIITTTTIGTRKGAEPEAESSSYHSAGHWSACLSLMPQPVPEAPFNTLDLPAVSHDQVALKAKTHDKEDPYAYAFSAARLTSLAGLAGGLQEAFYTFNNHAAGRPVSFIRQMGTYGGIIGRKTLLGATLGAVFAYTEASLENSRGVHDSWNGIAGGAAAGVAFGILPPKPWPQPVAYALWFGSAIYACDILNEKIPACLHGFRPWGPPVGRENWGDPMPPRPPVLETGASVRPTQGQFWRGA